MGCRTYSNACRICRLCGTGGNGKGERLVNLLAEDHSEPQEDGRHTVLLEAYGYRWYRIGALDYLLKRSAM